VLNTGFSSFLKLLPAGLLFIAEDPAALAFGRGRLRFFIVLYFE